MNEFVASAALKGSALPVAGGSVDSFERLISAGVDVLTDAGDWKSLLFSFGRQITRLRKDMFVIFVVISRDLRFRWTSHQELLGEPCETKYEDLLPLNADFGDSKKSIKAPNSGIRLVDEVALATGVTDFILFRGTERGAPTLYTYVGVRRQLSMDEELALALVDRIFDSVVRREFVVGEHLSHASRLTAAIDLGNQLHEGALANNVLNKIADIIQKRMGIDYVALMVTDETGHALEFAGMSESLTPLYDNPQSMSLSSMIVGVAAQSEPLVIKDIESIGYKPLGTGTKWAALVPVKTNSKSSAILILESKSPVPLDDFEFRDVEFLSQVLGARMSSSLLIEEKNRKILFRNMLLEEILLLHRENDPVRIAEEALSFINSVIPSSISVFYVLNEGRSLLIPVTSRGVFAEEMLSFSVKIGEGIVGRTISKDKPVHIQEANADASSISIPGTPNEPEAILAIPIKSVREDIGVIALHRIGKKTFSAEEIEMAEITGRQFSTVMERANAAMEIHKSYVEKEKENAMHSLLSEQLIESLDNPDSDTFSSRVLDSALNFSTCEAGMLLLRRSGESRLQCICADGEYFKESGCSADAASLSTVLHEMTKLATRTYTLEGESATSAAIDSLGADFIEGTAPGFRNMLIHESSEKDGQSVVLIGFDFQSNLRKDVYRNTVTQRLLDFYNSRHISIKTSRNSHADVVRLNKLAAFKDAIVEEVDVQSIYGKVCDYAVARLNASFAAIYSVDYVSGILRLVASSGGGGVMPQETLMKYAAHLTGTHGTQSQAIEFPPSDDENVPAIFRNRLATWRMSTIDGADLLFIAGYAGDCDITEHMHIYNEMAPFVSRKVRQLSALSEERRRHGLISTVDEIGKKVGAHTEFGSMMDAFASAAGHIIGTEYALAGVLSSSYIEWSGYFETRIPDSIEKLALKTAEKGEAMIINDFRSAQIETEPVSGSYVREMLMYPLFKDSGTEIRAVLLLINRFGSDGFSESDVALLDRLASNVINSYSAVETLKQEKQLKRAAELKWTELAEILDGIDEPIIRVDTSGNIEFINSAAKQLLSMRPGVAAEKIVSLLDEVDTYQIVDLTENIRKGERFESSYLFASAEGAKRVIVSASPLSGRNRRGLILRLKEEPQNETQEPKDQSNNVKGAEVSSAAHSQIEGVRYAMKRGFSYMIAEQKPLFAYLALVDFKKAGFNPLVITRQHPSKLREKYDMGNTEIRWLTQVVGNSNLDPAKLSVIGNAMLSFIERHKNAVVFIDGLEYLLSNNSMIKVMGMLEGVMQKTVDTSSVLVVAVDKMTFEQRELAILEKLFEEVNVGEMRKGYLSTELEKFDNDKPDSTETDAND